MNSTDIDHLRPRHQAAAILSIKTSEARRSALALIDNPRRRAIVRFYVEDDFARRLQRNLPDLSRLMAEEDGI
jgi:hypothetical protein